MFITAENCIAAKTYIARVSLRLEVHLDAIHRKLIKYHASREGGDQEFLRN